MLTRLLDGLRLHFLYKIVRTKKYPAEVAKGLRVTVDQVHARAAGKERLLEGQGRDSEGLG